MIEIKKLAFSYSKQPVLSNIDMKLESGKIYGLLGENGVGKTTLLTLLSGLKKPLSGTITVNGMNPFDRHPSFLSSIYYLPDEVSSENMPADRWSQLNGIFWPEYSHEKFLTILKEFEVAADKKLSEMSAGMLKKTYIAQALACNTKYIFMDEPTNGLDIPSKTSFRSAILKYTSDDTTVVISTHQVRDLENIIDPIIILDKQDVLLNASIETITSKLYFDYGNTIDHSALYFEQLPGGFVQVSKNTSGEESKVNIEALFNTVYKHKALIKEIFNQ